MLRLVVLALAIDIVGYQLFVRAAQSASLSPVGAVRACELAACTRTAHTLARAARCGTGSRDPCWTARAGLLMLFVCTPLREAARRYICPHRARVPRSAPLDAAAALFMSAAASTFVVVTAMLMLKLELEERGKAADVPGYAYLIGAFFLAAALAPACALEKSATSVSYMEVAVADPDDDGTVGAGGAGGAGAGGGAWRGVALETLSSRAAVAPFALSAVAVGATAIAPPIVRRLFHRAILSHSHARLEAGTAALPAHTARSRGARFPAPLRWLLGSALALLFYVGRARWLVAGADFDAGPFLRECPPRGGDAHTSPRGGDAHTSPRGGDVEVLTIGDRWSIARLMYGVRRVHVSPYGTQECPRTDAVTDPDPQLAHRSTRGVVMAADGSTPKYADAVYIVARNIRHVHRSDLPIEVFHVGYEERFATATARRREHKPDLLGLIFRTRLPAPRPRLQTRLTWTYLLCETARAPPAPRPTQFDDAARAQARGTWLRGRH